MLMRIARRLPWLGRTMEAGGSAGVLARASAGVYLLKVAGAALFFAVQVVFARILGLESFGIYALAYAWLSVLLLFGRQGLDAAAVRYVAAYCGRQEWRLLGGFLRFSRTAVLAASTAAAALFAAAVWLMRSQFGAETLLALWVAAATVPVFALAQLHEAVLRGLKCLVRGSLPLVVVHPAMLIVALPAVASVVDGQVGAEAAMATYLVASLLSLAVLWPMVMRRTPAGARREAPDTRRRAWLAAAFSMMLVTGFSPILNQLGVIIVGALDGSASAGLYSAAIRVANLIQLQIIAVTATYSPLAADLHARGAREELQRVTTLCARLAFVGALAAAAIVAGLGEWILGLLGPEFVPAFPALAALVIGQLLLGAAAPAGVLLNMTGHHAAAARIFAAGAVANVALSLALVPLMGVFGAAAASLAATALTVALMAVAAARRLGIAATVAPWPAKNRPGQPPVNLNESLTT